MHLVGTNLLQENDEKFLAGRPPSHLCKGLGAKMIIYFWSYHFCHPLEKKMYFNRGRLQFKKGRMMRTSFCRVQAKERRRTSVGIQLVFIMMEAQSN
jgi:hypothetical protein